MKENKMNSYSVRGNKYVHLWRWSKLIIQREGQKLRNLGYQTYDGPDARRLTQLYRQISLETPRELIAPLAIFSNFSWAAWL